MLKQNLHNCPELTAYVDEVGILPLLFIGVRGWSAEESVDPDCRYVSLPDGGWEWPLWKWKGDIVRESHCAYGKFIDGKATFVSREYWPHLCNWRRSLHPLDLDDGSIESTIVYTLSSQGSMITRELRNACGFNGPKMRSRFDNYITKLQMWGYIVTEDFVYPTDRHGHEYGWGWALLSTPEQLFGREACHPDCTPEESRDILIAQLRRILPWASEEFFHLIVGEKRK